MPIYKHPGATLASSKVFTLETLNGTRDSTTETHRSKEYAYYASRPCNSVIAGMLLAFENGFQRLMRSHHPDTESPKFRGELSSSCT